MKVYLDAVSTTAVDPEVRDTYKKLLDEYYCNSDALYDDGVAIYDMQEKARELIASYLGVKKNEIVFTSGASEANSLAIKGLCLKHPEKKHVITSIYEHSSVYNSFKQLEEDFGYEVSYLLPDENGHITPEAVEKEIRNQGYSEIKSNLIGEMVMDRLAGLDEVAYVRFASVYRQFKDINVFIDELKELMNKEN